MLRNADPQAFSAVYVVCGYTDMRLGIDSLQSLERQSQFFKGFGIHLRTNTMANWMIMESEQYLSILYDELHNHLYDSEVIHADETPFQVIRDDRSPRQQKLYVGIPQRRMLR